MVNYRPRISRITKKRFWSPGTDRLTWYLDNRRVCEIVGEQFNVDSSGHEHKFKAGLIDQQVLQNTDEKICR